VIAVDEPDEYLRNDGRAHGAKSFDMPMVVDICRKLGEIPATTELLQLAS
jgi:hypothetical protein